MRSDERIREDVNDRLTQDPELDATEIEVTVKNGEVTLAGSVADRADRRRAEDCAEQVAGVKHVQNNIRARPMSQIAGNGASTRQSATTGEDDDSGLTRRKN
jgi:osmotically-inducible protein OsmY